MDYKRAQPPHRMQPYLSLPLANLLPHPTLQWRPHRWYPPSSMPPSSSSAPSSSRSPTPPPKPTHPPTRQPAPACKAPSPSKAKSTTHVTTPPHLPPQLTTLTKVHQATLLSFYQSAHHWFQSSSQRPTCIIEPDSPSDVAVALRILGETRTPFAVMSGGHASNQGFSSTEGVHVSLRRMKGVVVKEGGVVEVGFGAVSLLSFSFWGGGVDWGGGVLTM